MSLSNLIFLWCHWLWSSLVIWMLWFYLALGTICFFFFILGCEYTMNENTKMYQGKIEPKHIHRFRFFKFIFRCCENASLNNSLFTSHHIINPRSCSSSVTPCKSQVRSISLHTAFLLFCRAPSMRRLFKKYCHSRISSFVVMLIGFEKTPSEEHWFCLVITSTQLSLPADCDTPDWLVWNMAVRWLADKLLVVFRSNIKQWSTLLCRLIPNRFILY